MIPIDKIKEMFNYIALYDKCSKYSIISFEDILEVTNDEYIEIIKDYKDADEFVELAVEKYKILSVNIYKKIHTIPAILKKTGYILDWKNLEFDFFFGREKELFKMKVIFNKKIKKNILLVGPPGVGKTQLVWAFARKYEMKNIFVVECARLISNSEYRGSFEKKVVDLLEYAKINQLILFFDEIHALVGLGKTEGGISITDILKPYLIDSSIKFIGATTLKEVIYLIEDEAFKRRFSIINVDEPDISMLKCIKNNFEAQMQNKILTDEELEHIISELDNKLPDLYFPDKLVDFLDFVNAYQLVVSEKIDCNYLIGEYINDQKQRVFDGKCI